MQFSKSQIFHLCAKSKWPLTWLVGLVLGYAIIGFELVPYVIKEKLTAILAQKTQQQVVLHDVAFNPFTWTLSLKNLELQDQQQASLLKLGELFVDADVLGSLTTLTLNLEQLRLDDPEVSITALKDGGFNFDSLIQDDQEEEQDSSNLPLTLGQLQLVNGQINWRDERMTEPVTTKFSGINLAMDNLSTTADDAAKLNLAALLPEKGKLGGNTDLTLAKHELKGNLKLEKIQLAQLWSMLLKDRVNFAFTDGETDLNLDYLLSYQNGLQLQINNGSITNHKVQISPLTDQQPVITLGELTIKDINFDLAQQNLQIGLLEARHGDINAWLDADGKLNYQTLFSSNSLPDGSATTSTAEAISADPNGSKVPDKPWTVNIGHTNFEHIELAFSDQNPQHSYQADVAEANVNLGAYQLSYSPQTIHMQLDASKLRAQYFNLRDFKQTANSKPAQAQLTALNVDLGAYTLDTGTDLALPTAAATTGNQQMQMRLEPSKLSAREFSLTDFKLAADSTLGRGQLAALSLELGPYLLRSGKGLPALTPPTPLPTPTPAAKPATNNDKNIPLKPSTNATPTTNTTSASNSQILALPTANPDDQQLQMQLDSINLATRGLNIASLSSAASTKPLQAKLATLDLNLGTYRLQANEVVGSSPSKNSAYMQIDSGKINLKDISVANFKQSNPTPPLQARLGTFAIDVGAANLYKTDKLQLIGANSNALIQQLQLQEFGVKKPLISLASLGVQGIGIDLEKQLLNAKSLRAANAHIYAWLDQQGVLNYQTLFPQTEQPHSFKSKLANKATLDSSKPNWDMLVEEAQLQDFNLQLEDRTRTEPLQWSLTNLDLQAQNLNNQPGSKLPFSLKAQLNEQGHIQATGYTILDPLFTEAQVNLNGIKLEPLQAYTQQFARIDIIDGSLNTNAKISLNKLDNKSDLLLHAQGTASIDELLLRDQLQNKDLIKWRTVKLDGVDFYLDPLNLTIAHLLLQDPYGRITIKKDHSLNFDDILIKHPPAAAAKHITAPEVGAKTKPPPSDKKPKPRYQIKAVTIDGGSSDFSDFSLILPFAVQINDLHGAITSISSEQTSFTDFSLAGKVFDLSPMDVKGRFKPDFSGLNIGMHFQSMPLPFISPYMVEFAGYKLEKGKMSLDLLYNIENRKLTAENNVVLEQLTLGEQVENPKATSLPLNLAITLLKDAHGNIAINMPIKGSLDDPQFDVGSLLLDAFVNVVTRVASAPFSLLGSAIASLNDQVDMSKVTFDKAIDKLAPKQLTQLVEIAKGLQQKPELHVEIKGIAYEKQDWPAMQDEALIEQLKSMKAAELKKAGKSRLPEHINLDQEETERLLGEKFLQKFPQQAKRSFFGKAELLDPNQDFEAVAKERLAEIIPPNQQKLSALAASRARNIAQYLIQKGGISHQRVFILESDVKPESSNSELASELRLSIQ